MNPLFISKYRGLLGDEADEFFESLVRKKKRYFRINRARGVDYLEELKDYVVSSSTMDAVYSYEEPNEVITNTISFLTGGIYIQNPSSIIPARLLVELLNGDGVVLDVSAAPGGKTTAMSEYSKRTLNIVANEPSKSRLKSLHFNLEKYGAWNVKTVSFDGRLLHKKLPPVFDGILLDAPCSNENKIGYSDEVSKHWSQDLVDKMQKLQMEILFSISYLLKPGGVLLYSTCTFSVEENEGNVIKFLELFPDFELIDINRGSFCYGLSGENRIDEKVIRVFPHKSDFDGFFVAALRKKGELKKGSIKIPDNTTTLKDFFPEGVFSGIFKKIDDLLFYELLPTPDFKNIKFLKSGIKAGKTINGSVEISSQFLWEFGRYMFDRYKIKVDKKNAIEFLSGFDINLKFEKEKFALFYNGIPVGVVKNLDGYLKNKLDRYFLFGRGTLCQKH
ncbi:MAG: hypothetical protein N3C60_09800 [Calditerrivibrio sp.]|nr:hypothetical protein [Calditerrivibrio sp.]